MIKNIKILISFIILIIIPYRLHGEQINDLIRLCLSNNPGYKNKMLEIKEARASQIKALGAFFPQISLTTRAMYMSKPLFEGITLEAGSLSSMGYNAPGMNYFPPTDIVLMEPMSKSYYSLGVDYQQAIFTSGKIFTSYLLSFYNAKLKEIDVEQYRENLISKLIEAYYNYKLSIKAVALTGSALSVGQEYYEKTKAAFETEAASVFQLKEAEAKKKEAELNVLEAKNNKAAAKMYLEFLVNNDITIITDTEIKIPEREYDFEKFLSIAMTNRFDYRKLQISKKMAKINKWKTISDLPMMPQIGVFLSYSINNDKMPFFEWNWKAGVSDNFMAGINLQMKLFDGLGGWSDFIKSVNDQNKTIYGEESLTKGIKIAVFNAITKCINKKKNLEFKQSELERDQRDYEDAVKRHKVGSITELEMLNKKLTLQKTKLEYFNAIKELITADCKLSEVVGEKRY